MIPSSVRSARARSAPSLSLSPVPVRVLVLGTLLLSCSALSCSPPVRPPPLPLLAQVPTFALTDHTGRPFGSADLAGKVWVANFIFTRCPDICPLFTRKLAEVRTLSPSSIHLISFSVDPTFDTPPVLAAYAKSHGAIDPRWHFLTGDHAEIQRTVEQGMKIGMEGQPGAPPASIVHGSWFVLVDATMRVRGYYPMDEKSAPAKVARDAARLATEP